MECLCAPLIADAFGSYRVFGSNSRRGTPVCARRFSLVSPSCSALPNCGGCDG